MAKRNYDQLSSQALRQIAKEIGREHPWKNLNQLCTEAGVSYTTVSNLVECKTRFPRLSTVLKLSWASGIEWTVCKDGTLDFQHVRMKRALKRLSA